MRQLLFILIASLSFLYTSAAYAQKVTDSGYRTVAYIKADGTIQDAGYRTIGTIANFKRYS